MVRYSSYSRSTRWGWVVSVTPRLRLPPGSTVQEAGWASQPVWTQRLEEKSFRLCRGWNHDRPVVQLVARHYTDWAIRLTYYIQLGLYCKLQWSVRTLWLSGYLSLLLRIRKVPGLNLGSEIGYPDWGSLWFSVVPAGECRYRTSNYAMAVSFHIPSNSSFAYHSFFQNNTVCVTEKTLLNYK
jgi:hypothetical protein